MYISPYSLGCNNKNELLPIVSKKRLNLLRSSAFDKFKRKLYFSASAEISYITLAYAPAFSFCLTSLKALMVYVTSSSV